MRSRRLLSSPVALVLAAMLLAACGQCGDDAVEAPSAPLSDDALPRGAADVTQSLANALPTDVGGAVFVRGWTTAFERYAAARPRLEQVTGDLGFVETDLRNTLGVDLRRADSLAELGVAPGGGLAIFAIDEQPAFLMHLRDPSTFLERANATLTAPPFSLDAEPETVATDVGTLVLYRRAGQQRVEAAVGTFGVFGVVLPAPPTGGPLASFERLAAVAPPDSLGATPAFAASASVVGDAAYLLHLDPTLATVDAGGEPRTIVSGPDWLERAVGRAGAGCVALDLDADGLTATWTQRPSERALADLQRATEQATEPPFQRLVNDDVFTMVRLTFAPSELLSIARTLDDGAMAEDIDAAVASINERLGTDVVTSVLPALGRHWIAMTTRARLLTLNRAMSSNAPGDWFNGLGIVVAVDVRQRAPVQAALEAAAAALGERATLFDEDGVSVLEFTDSDADIGNLILTDRFLMLVPSRQRADYLGQVRTGDGSSLAQLEALGGDALVTEPSMQGLFVDVQQLVNGPVGTVALARLPDEARAALAQFDRIVLDSRVGSDAVTTSLTLQFAPPADP